MFRVYPTDLHPTMPMSDAMEDVFDAIHWTCHNICEQPYCTVPEIKQGLSPDYTYTQIAHCCRRLAAKGYVRIEDTGIATQAPAPTPATEDDDKIIPLDGIRVTGEEHYMPDAPRYLRNIHEWLGNYTLGLEEYVDMVFLHAEAWTAFQARRALATEGLTEFNPYNY